MKTRWFKNQPHASCLSLCTAAWMGAIATGCSSTDEGSKPAPQATAGTGAGSSASGGRAGSRPAMQTGQGERSSGFPAKYDGDDGSSMMGAKCGSTDNPEQGLQG